jgi:4-hydroxy-2-oxoheptanedioate aldolase
MSVLSSLAERMAQPGTKFAAWGGMPFATIAAHLARLPFEAVALDMQHGLYDFAEMARAITLVTAAGKPAIVRVPVGEFQTASRALDAGASAVIAPMVNTLEDARRLVSFTKFPPVGERSWGPHGAIAISGLGMGDYLAQANGFTLVLAMIETREAIVAVDDILAVAGIDGVFVGPADTSIALSNGARVDPLHKDVDEAFAHVLKRARAAKKYMGAFAGSGERAKQHAGDGFDLVTVGSDTLYLRAGAEHMLKVARGG